MKYSSKHSIATVLFCFVLNCCFAQTYFGVQSLVQRRVPWLSNHLVLDSIAQKNGKDIVILSQQNKKIKISASSASAASKGVYYYLTHYCHRSMSHLGDNLSAVKTLPSITKPDTILSPFNVRYALNYCTISYSMAFYDWNMWEHELDWMAFNGVNLMLAPVGTEAVWQNVLKQFGFSDKELQSFIPGPAFTAWWLMGNEEGWGGPVSNGYIARQQKLQQQVLQRMRTLGIQPVLQGFYGMVPATLKEKYKDWNIVKQGNWAGGFRRPDILIPTDPNFSSMAKAYYSAVKKLYGDDIKYFGGEPFHEGGIATGIDVPACAAAIQKTMIENFPNSTWVLQGWQNNPTDNLLARLDKKHVLIEELFGENTDNWNKRKGYNNSSFIWCTVTNFGEKQGLYGKLQRFANEVYRAKKSEFAGDMKGVGIMPEGIINNPVVYDFVLDLAWGEEKKDAAEWVKNYVYYRYGSNSDTLQQAWQIFLQTIYSSPTVLQEGPEESVFCARPSFEGRSVSSWGTRARNYDTALFAKGVRLFLSYKNGAHNEPYETDKIDLVRQVQSNRGEGMYANLKQAWLEKDSSAFRAAANTFLNGILHQDSLLSGSKFFQLNRWLTNAYSCMTDGNDRDLFLWNAKAQITYWGPDNNPRTDLHEYSHKEWNGMMRHFYYPRWQMLVNYCMDSLRGKSPALPDYYKFETGWAKEKNLYPPIKLSVAEQSRLAHRILFGN